MFVHVHSLCVTVAVFFFFFNYFYRHFSCQFYWKQIVIWYDYYDYLIILYYSLSFFFLIRLVVFRHFDLTFLWSSYCYDSSGFIVIETNYKFYDFCHVWALMALLGNQFEVVCTMHIIHHLPLIRPLCASHHTIISAETLSSDAFLLKARPFWKMRG